MEHIEPTEHNGLSRRDFSKLTMAAFGGLLAGAAAGCNRETPQQSSDSGAPPAEKPQAKPAAEPSVAYLLEEPHVCRGLNTCANKGASGKNECAGQGTCASVKAHDCAGQNDCKGQGGCGEFPGQNGCKQLGQCHVPLMDTIWDKARAAFEKAMKDQGKQVGAAPPLG
jgi:hypothetical protein